MKVRAVVRQWPSESHRIKPTMGAGITRGAISSPRVIRLYLVLVIFIFGPNVTGQGTRHLVEGTLDPLVGLLVFCLNYGSSDKAIKYCCPLSGGVIRPVRVTSQKIR